MDSYLTAKEAYIKQRDSPWQRPAWAKGQDTDTLDRWIR